MKTTDSTFDTLMKQDNPFVIRREPTGYSACVPSLGILVTAETLDECYVKAEERKRIFFEAIVKKGFGDSMLSVRSPSAKPRPFIRMLFVLAVLSLLLLTILIPANYLLAELTLRVPVYAETAMDVVQRRIGQLSDNDRQKIAGLLARMSPVMDELIEARCKRVLADSASTPGGKSR